MSEKEIQTKKCKSCVSEVVKLAKICPECGAKFKMGIVKKVLIGIGTVFALLMAIGVIVGPTPAPTPTVAPVTAPVKTPEQISQDKAAAELKAKQEASEAAKITDADKALLIKSQYKLFTEDELKHFGEIENKYFNYLTDAEKTEVKADFERLYAQKKYQAWIKSQFSVWDGANKPLVDLLKKNLNDAKSFDHEETTYKDMKDHLIIKMTYRAKNSFGALILQNVTAKADYKTNVISIISQNN